MDSGLKKQWVDALRSGSYRQSTGYLRDDIDNGFCCLGVLCEILVEKERLERVDIGYNYVGSGNRNADMRTELDLDLRLELGLDMLVWDGDGNRSELQARLINLNDVDKADFNKIADYLENTEF